MYFDTSAQILAGRAVTSQVLSARPDAPVATDRVRTSPRLAGSRAGVAATLHRAARWVEPGARRTRSGEAATAR